MSEAGVPGALVEKVEEAIRNVWFRTPGDPAHPAFQREARAAISIVVEECAEKAASFDWYSAGMPAGTKPEDVEALSAAIAAAIRRLDGREG